MTETTRKLAAIMFTDIVGYSRIMSLNEAKGLNLLDQHDKILQQAIEKNNGNILKKMGDAVLAEFNSSVNAVNCAIDIQVALKNFNEDKPSDDKIIIRIGIHLGDVIVRDDDLFGEGINVAARLETLAPPGGICLSQAVYQSVKSHTDVKVDSLGEVELKNIVEKYTVYTIPSFYSHGLTDTSISKQEEPKLNFKIKNIERLPPPSRLYRSVLGITVLSSFLLIIIVMIGAIMSIPPGIKRGEIENPIGLISKLQNNNDPASSYVYRQLSVEIQQLINEFDIMSSVSDTVRNDIRHDLNRLIRQDKLLFDEEILQSIDLSKDIMLKIQENPEGENLFYLNRLLIGNVFSSVITKKPEPVISYFTGTFMPEIFSVFFYTRTIIISLLCIFGSGVLAARSIAFTTLRVIFSNIRHVDSILEYFIEQMGYKTAIKEKGYLIFKPTVSKFVRDFFIGFPNKIRVRVDGNSVIITSTIPAVRRLEKQLKSFAN